MSCIKKCYPGFALPNGGFALPPGFPGDYPGVFGEHAPGAAGPDPGPAPLLNFAPGMAVDPWGVGAQVPAEQPFFYSVAEMLAAGVVGSPYTIYGHQEAAGAGQVNDLVGANHLATVTAAPNSPTQGMPAVGIYHGGVWDGSIKKCLDLQHNNSLCRVGFTPNHMPGTDDFVVFMLARIGWPSSNTQLCSTMTSSINPGWGIQVNGRFAVTIAPFTTVTVGAEVDGGWGGTWQFLCGYINRATAKVGFRTGLNNPPEVDITAWGAGSIGGGDFRYGGSPQPSLSSQVAYAAFWHGAEATAFIANINANLAILNRHGDPPDNMLVDSSLSSPGVGLEGPIAPPIAESDALGTLAASWSGRSSSIGVLQFPWVHDSESSRDNKLNAACENHAAASLQLNWITYSVIVSTWWTFANSSFATGYATYGVGPQGMKNVEAVYSTASPGTMKGADMTCVVGEIWGLGVYVKRGETEVADVVGCRLIAWDDNNLAEIDAVTFTATEKWQWIRLPPVTIPAGCIDIQMHIEIPWAGVDRYIHPTLMTATRQAALPFPQFTWGVVDDVVATIDYQLIGTAAGAYIKGLQGEIEVVFRGKNTRSLLDQTLFDSFAAGGTHNCIRVVLDSSNRFVFTHWDATAALGSVTTPVIANPDEEHTIVGRWNKDGLPSGNTIEITVDGGAPIGASPAWASASDTAVDHYFGCAKASNVNPNGFISSIRTWEFPR